MGIYLSTLSVPIIFLRNSKIMYAVSLERGESLDHLVQKIRAALPWFPYSVLDNMCSHCRAGIHYVHDSERSGYFKTLCEYEAHVDPSELFLFLDSRGNKADFPTFDGQCYNLALRCNHPSK